MRDPNRIAEALSLIEEYWTLNPDLRLGQVLHAAKGASELSIYYTEDDRIIARLKEMIQYTKDNA